MRLDYPFYHDDGRISMCVDEDEPRRDCDGPYCTPTGDGPRVSCPIDCPLCGISGDSREGA